MGLDQYAYKTRDDRCSGAFSVPDDGESYEIHYWRKHPDLHGWMYGLYVSKGGSTFEEDFNVGEGVELTLEDLKRLEDDVLLGELPKTTGFFFGESSESDQGGDFEFIKKAREAIHAGYKVYYTSWW